MYAERIPSAERFARAMRKVGRPGGNQMMFLEAHFSSPSRASTATKLARAAGYKDFRGVNACYGRLARRLGAALGRREAGLSLLVEFIRPRAVSNRHWILVMRPEFAGGMAAAGWIRQEP